MSYFISDLSALPQALLGTAIIYFSVMIYTQIFGLKSFSKMTGFDFANTIAIGSLIASSITTGSPSLVLGMLLIGALFALNFLVIWLRKKVPSLQPLTENTPMMLMRKGEILHENLEKTQVTEGELRGKLREANVLQLSQVKAVVLETTGDVSVLHSTDDDLEVDEYILKGVDRY